MPCVNHPENDVQSYCQSCGKALCSSCVHTTASGQILCQPCYAAHLAGGGVDPTQAYWQAAQAFVTPPRGTPNPSVAAVLGLIPGVGAMYNGQLFKGLIHVVIFAVLISITDRYGVFGIFIAAWVLYQSFEAFHTAKARRDGLPLPDPFGLNEVGNWLNLGGRPSVHSSGPVGVPPIPPNPPGPGAPPPPAGYAAAEPPPYSAPYTSSYTTPGATPPPSYGEPFPGVNPGTYGESYPPGYIPPPPPIPPMPPMPPAPPYLWRRREPVWAVVLIILGVVFLLHTLGVVGDLFHYAWPVLLIGFGVWLIIRRLGYSQGGSK